MVAATETFADWLAQAQVPEGPLTPNQRALLQAAFHFRQQQGTDYYATRVLGHFLLHCHSGLKVAQLARLLHLSRPTASRQQGLSAKQTIQQAHHRMDGRPYGKLLPRYAGPLAQFLFNHPNAPRADAIDFIDRTFGIRVARVALYKFLKKYGLLAVPALAPTTAAVGVVSVAEPPTGVATLGTAPLPPPVLPAAAPVVLQGQPLPTPAPPFSAHARSTRAPSS
jgi:hypothetical protein